MFIHYHNIYMEQNIRISSLNDFTFCPKSIYFHNLYENYERQLYQDTPQVTWTISHENIDNKHYSTSKNILQWFGIYSEKYNLVGKVDIYQTDKKTIIERKTKISKLYQWQIYQVYAQYFCLTEMWYEVKKLKIHSLSDNKIYDIPIPNKEEIEEFEKFLDEFRKFDPSKPFEANPEKCKKCIYRELCDSY